MKTLKTNLIKYQNNIRNVTSKRAIKVFALAMILAISFANQPLPAQVTLTGAVEFSTDGLGNAFDGSIWDTTSGTGPGARSDIFFISGPNYSTGSFINGPTDSQAAINIPLTAGNIYTFSYVASPGDFNANHALNLFFNGNNVNPNISVFGPTQTNGITPSFAANGGVSTYSPVANSGTVPGANSLTYQNGNTLVTLTGYFWAEPSLYNIDRTSAPFGDPGFVGTDGNPDWIGQFTLNVTTVPEPQSIALIALGAGALIAVRKKKS